MWRRAQKTLVTPKARRDVSLRRRRVLSADGRGVYVTTDKDCEFQRLGVHGPRHAAAHARSPTRHQVGRRRASSSRTTARPSPSSTNEDGVGRLHLLDTATRQGSGPSPELPAGVIGALALAPQRPRARLHRSPRRARRRTSTRSTRRRGKVDALDRERDWAASIAADFVGAGARSAGRASTAARSRASSTSRAGALHRASAR